MRSAHDGAQRGGLAGISAPEDEAGGHFEVEHGQGPVLDEVDGVRGGRRVFRSGEVRVKGDDDVGFHQEGEERG